MPTQMPSTGRPRQPRSTIAAAADRGQPGHARGERADAGHDQPVGLDRRAGVGGDGHVGPDPLEGALGRAEIARPVVEDDDALHRLQDALGGRHALHARVELDGRPQRAGDRLVLRLGDVVPVAAACTVTCSAIAAW